MYCFFNKFFFKVEIFGNLPIFCHAHLVAIQDFVDREILFDRCGKCPMLCLFFDFKWTISAVKSTAHVMPCFMRQHSAFLCGGLAFAAINDKEIVKERDCEIVFEFNIHNVYVQSFQIAVSGEESEPNTERNHSDEDAVFIGAFVPASNPLSGLPDNCLVMATEGGGIYVAVKQDKVEIKGDVEVQGKVKVRDDVIAKTISLVNHKHTDSRNGNTSAPLP